MNKYGFIGFILVILSLLAIKYNILCLKMSLFPLLGWGFIFLIDNIVFVLTKNSLIVNRRKEFFLSIPVSVIFWSLFEFYNIIHKRWGYEGFPSNLFVVIFGFIISNSILLPSFLEAVDLLKVNGIFRKLKMKEVEIFKAQLYILMFIGIVSLAIVFLFLKKFFLIEIIWIGTIFFIDPINYFLSGRTLIRNIELGNVGNLLSLIVGGYLTGVLWGGCNFWAATRIVYFYPKEVVPHLFGAPMTHYLADILFNINCFVVFNFVLILFKIKPNDNLTRDLQFSS